MENKRKNVAIMTWVNFNNYGSLLQATALQNIVGDKYNVSIINYEHKYSNMSGIGTVTDKIINKIKEKVGNKIFNKSQFYSEEQIKLFDDFREKYLKLTEPCYDVSDLTKLNKEFDIFIAGSDQIWTPLAFNDYYFLNFVDNDKLKIAYAPSLGGNLIREELIDIYKEYLSSFDALSIRETQSVPLIKDTLGLDIVNVLDPTLLMDADDWQDLFKLNNLNDKYVLAYFLGKNKSYWEKVKNFADDNGWKLIIIPTHREDYKYGEVRDVDPRGFVELIKNASYVCTDSFHGVAFSIIFNKQFSVFKRFKDGNENKQNARIYNILDTIGDSSPLVVNDIVKVNLDYTKINIKLSAKREESINFLENSLRIDKKVKFTITSRCTGCGACKEICPKQAISIKMNKDGFYQSFVDDDLCIRCNRCKNICPSNNKVLNEADSLYSFKANEDVLYRSSSGGIAYEIARIMANEGKLVYGCVINNGQVYHELSDKNDINSLTKFQGSKYLQSDFSKNLSSLLTADGEKVVFGTPCQIAGLDNILRNKKIREQYLLVDLICHGVPTYNLWTKCKKSYEKQYKGKVNKVVFRSEGSKWHTKTMAIKVDNKDIIIKEKDNPFYYFFNMSSCYNNCCYMCDYREKSCADIRIGDFWGQKFRKDKTGVSMAIPFTEKGEKVLYMLNCTKQDIQDFYNAQQHNNIFKPIYYDKLINGFKDDNSNIEDYEDYIKVSLQYDKVVRIYAKLRRLI